MDLVRRHNTLAADYLYLAACVDSKDVPLDILHASSPREREDAIKVLSNYEFVTRRPADSAFDLHRLVHRGLREWLQKQQQLGRWTQHAITQLLQVFPDHDHGNNSKWRRLRPHAQCTLSYSLTEGDDKDRLTLMGKCVMALCSDGRYTEAPELQMRIVQTRKRVLGDEHSFTLTSMANLASTYSNQGR